MKRFLSLLLLALSGIPSFAQQKDNLITNSGAGKVKLGMTLAELKKAVPAAAKKTVKDREGDELTYYTIPDKPAIKIYIYGGKVSDIAISGSGFALSNGLKAGSTYAALKKAGAVKEIMASDDSDFNQVTVMLAGYSNIIFQLKITPALKGVIKKYKGKIVPAGAIPADAIVEMIDIQDLSLGGD